MARSSRAEWAKRVERWRDRGLTAKEFAAETGVKASSLTFWKWKLNADERSGRAVPQPSVHEVRKRRSASPSTTRAPKPGFVELSASVVSTPTMREVVLGDVLSVRFPTGFDETTLTRIVRAVGAAR